MSDEPGLAFDRVAEDYDRVRRGYPEELVEAACEIAGLSENSYVVEVGCGTGKLTRVLAERGLRVEAIDPGAQLVQVARRHVEGSAVRFHISRFEDLDLPAGAFAAVFSATAFHWVDPAVGWSKVARLLRPGGTLALLAHTIELDPEMLATWREMVTEAAAWVSRDERTLLEGAEARKGNVSQLWAWLVKRDIARPEAAKLFRDVHLDTVQIEKREAVAEVLAQIRTESAYLRLDGERQLQLEERIRAVIENMGGTYRPTLFTVLATARRA
ncbi:MAG: class I SAM-dependent methyltransferase [Actinobacteria bacterium]|nr:class I SAM-dependent methyltransferase [Actinomycetota bacterium]